MFNAEQIYHFLFETFPGVAILMGSCLVISIVACVIMEVRTRKRFRDRGSKQVVDEWAVEDAN